MKPTLIVIMKMKYLCIIQTKHEKIFLCAQRIQVASLSPEQSVLVRNNFPNGDHDSDISYTMMYIKFIAEG